MCIMPFVAASSYRSVNEDLGISSEAVSRLSSDSFDSDDEYDEAVVGVFGGICPSGQFRNQHRFVCARILNNIDDCVLKEDKREAREKCADGAVSTSCAICGDQNNGKDCNKRNIEVLRFKCRDEWGRKEKGKLAQCKRDGLVKGQSGICEKACDKDQNDSPGVCQCKICNSNFAIE